MTVSAFSDRCGSLCYTAAAGLWNTPRSYFQQVFSLACTLMWKTEMFPFLTPFKKILFSLVLIKYSREPSPKISSSCSSRSSNNNNNNNESSKSNSNSNSNNSNSKHVLVLAGISLIFFPAAGSGWNSADNTGMF